MKAVVLSRISAVIVICGAVTYSVSTVDESIITSRV